MVDSMDIAREYKKPKANKRANTSKKPNLFKRFILKETKWLQI